MTTLNPVPIVPVEGDAAFWDDHEAVRECLREPTPRLPPWFGYDERGSQLFEAITELPTYYLTRTERALLRGHAAELAQQLGARQVVELGSGSAKKTRLLLAACLRQRPTSYLPIDVSREMLAESGAELCAEFPELSVRGLWGRYEAALSWLRDREPGPIAVLFLGSNLGNTTQAERAALLGEIAATLRQDDRFLVSVDLLKSAQTFETCYNDPPGYSAFADFRLNYLTHLNRRFDADFVLECFRPQAHFNAATGTVEGHLYATRAHSVSVPGLGISLRLGCGDSINVGFSAKFDRSRFLAELARHGFEPHAEWVDPAWQYGVFLFRRT